MCRFLFLFPKKHHFYSKLDMLPLCTKCKWCRTTLFVINKTHSAIFSQILLVKVKNIIKYNFIKKQDGASIRNRPFESISISHISYVMYESCHHTY